MGRQEIAAQATSTAPVERVWALLADVTTWSDWGAWSSAVLDRPSPSGGIGGSGGVGAVRRLRLGRVTSVEEVVTFSPPNRLDYVLLSGLPVRDYRGEVRLAADPSGGTVIHWRSSFRGAYPLVGPLVRWRLQPFIADAARRLAAAASSTA